MTRDGSIRTAREGGVIEGEDHRRALAAQVMDRFAPPHVLVTREGEVVHFSRRISQFLEIVPGAPTQQLTRLARRELKPLLTAAFRQAVDTAAPARSTGAMVIGEDGVERAVEVVVEPLAGAPEEELLFVVLFLEHARCAAAPSAGRAEGSEIPSDGAELARVQARLNDLNSNYEVAVQELELSEGTRAALGRDLDALKADNGVLTADLEALDRAHDDLLALVDSFKVPTIVVDRDQIIRQFTPSANTLFNIRPEDRGRPLGDLTTQISLPGLTKTIQSVLDTGDRVEQAVYQEGAKAHFLLRAAPYGQSERECEGVILSFVDITRLTHDQVRQQMVIAELHHRVKNTLTVVIGLAQQTCQTSATLQSFIEAFTGRLQAMARAYDLISHEHWAQTTLDLLVRTELAPFNIERVTLDGPAISLEPEITLSLGMVLHELVTNAGKFGALSAPNGEVAVGWSRDDSKSGKPLVLQWTETNGPAVAPPVRRGFGLKFVDREVAYNLAGHADIDFSPKGLTARITVPLERTR